MHTAHRCASPRPTRPNLTTQPHTDTHHQSGHHRTAPVIPAKAAFMAIPRRELRGHKCLRLGTRINSYDFPQAMHPTSQHPHKRVATASHRTTDNQPNSSAYPETKPGHASGRVPCPDAQTTVREPPYAGTHHGQQGPGRPHRGPSNTAHASHSHAL